MQHWEKYSENTLKLGKTDVNDQHCSSRPATARRNTVNKRKVEDSGLQTSNNTRTCDGRPLHDSRETIQEWFQHYEQDFDQDGIFSLLPRLGKCKNRLKRLHWKVVITVSYTLQEYALNIPGISLLVQGIYVMGRFQKYYFYFINYAISTKIYFPLYFINHRLLKYEINIYLLLRSSIFLSYDIRNIQCTFLETAKHYYIPWKYFCIYPVF